MTVTIGMSYDYKIETFEAKLVNTRKLVAHSSSRAWREEGKNNGSFLNLKFDTFSV